KGDICVIWAALTDTERLNRAVGMNKLAIEPLTNETAARFLLKTNLGGFTVEIEERPFEWTYLKHYKIRRVLRTGPASRLELDSALSPTPSGGTNGKMRLALEARYGVLSPIISLSAGKTIRRMADEIRKIDSAVAAGARPIAARNGGVNEREIERA